MPGGEFPACEIALEGEVGDAHPTMMRHHRTMDPAIVVVGVPTALGGRLPGMELVPSGLRALGLLDRLLARPGLAGVDLRDAGDLPIDPAFRLDPDRRAGNRAAICEFLPRERDLVASALRDAGSTEPVARILILGGDCTAHAGALAGLRAARPGTRLAIAWFDAHGDFNTPDSTPSGNVFGMPFAMICGRGDADLVAAADGPTVDEGHAALFGGQVLDEAESRMLAASKVAHFGAGMLATDAGQAAVAGWAGVIRGRVDGLYVAFDLDCLDATGGWAVAMPEPGGMAIETAVATVERLAAAIPIVGFGATAISLANGDADATADAVASLAEAALEWPLR
jgi:arginase